MTGLWKKSDIRKNTKPISGTHASSNFSKAARTRNSNQRRGAATQADAPHQYQAGPNLDIHTIRIRASDQKHSAQFIARNAKGWHVHSCWIFRGTRCHPVPCHPVPSRRAGRIHSPKNGLPLWCDAGVSWLLWVLATPLPGRRIRPATLEYGKTPEKFQDTSLAGLYFESNPNSSRSSGFDRKPSSSRSMTSFAPESELNFCIMQ